MEDMKKLVEKYKRELMEYSRQAPKPEKLSFPEMLPEEPPAQGVQEIRSTGILSRSPRSRPSPVSSDTLTISVR